MGEWMYSSTILEFSIRWRWVVSFMPRLLYPPPWERAPRWVEPRTGPDAVEKRKIPYPCWELNAYLHLVASRCTNWSIPAHSGKELWVYFCPSVVSGSRSDTYISSIGTEADTSNRKGKDIELLSRPHRTEHFLEAKKLSSTQEIFRISWNMKLSMVFTEKYHWILFWASSFQSLSSRLTFYRAGSSGGNTPDVYWSECRSVHRLSWVSFFMCILSPSRQTAGCYLDLATTASFQILTTSSAIPPCKITHKCLHFIIIFLCTSWSS
jgi:hypothetical protein